MPNYSPEAMFELEGPLAHTPASPFRRLTKIAQFSVLGAPRFIQGIEGAGVQIGPIVSRRPELYRGVTERFVTRAGLSRWFGDEDNVELCGSLNPARQGEVEKDKASVVYEHAYYRVVGMVDDKPDKLGASLLTLLATKGPHSLNPILLGAVGAEAERRTKALMDSPVAQQFDITPTPEGALFQRGLAEFEVVIIPVMDFASGHNFGEYLQHYANQEALSDRMRSA